MKAMKKGLMSIVGVALLGTQLVACGNTNTANSAVTPSNNADKTEPAATEAAAKPVEITWWNFPSFQALDGEVGKYEKEIIAAFNEKNPEIKVNLEMITFEGGPEKLNVAIASNTAPDVIYDAPGRIIDWGKRIYLHRLTTW